MTHLVSPDATPALAALDTLVGTWRYGGELDGHTTFAWLPGGNFLVQDAILTHDGTTHVSHELIGHDKPFMGEAADEVISRAYTDTGDTLDYTWELTEGVLTIWGGERGSPAYARAEISADGTRMAGAWTWPGGGYSFTAERTS